MPSQSQEGRAALLERAIRRKRAAAKTRRPGLPPRPEDQPALLGELQRSLWLLQQLDPSSSAYNLVQAFRAPTAPRTQDLDRALQQIVARHRLLRSTFEADGDRVLQVVAPEGEGVPRVERHEVGPGEAETTAMREGRRPFDLSRGPLLRLLLIEEPGGSKSLLVLVMHHILADERSLGIFWRELTSVYRGEKLEEEPAQFDDYVGWQASQGSAARDRGLRFWREHLEPLPEELRLPFETPPGVSRGDDLPYGRFLSRPASAEIRRGIRRVAATAGTTPFLVFAFVFRLLLHRYTEGRAIAFATPATQRSHPATAEMIGYFLNPVVVSTSIDESHSIEAAIRKFHDGMGDCLTHGSVPFDALVEELGPPRDGDRHPIFQTLFVYQEIPAPPRLDDAPLEPVPLDLGESKLDLTLFVSEPAAPSDPFEIAVEYRTDRYEEVWIQNLLGHYETLLRHLAAGLSKPAAELPLLPPEEEARLRTAARGPSLPAPEPGAPALLPDQIFRRALENPEAPAVMAGRQITTYRELVGRAHTIARALLDRGIAPGDRVGLFADRSSAMIAGLLGCHWAGAAYVPLDPAYPEARNRGVLEDAEAAAVLTATTRSLPSTDGQVPHLAIESFDAPSDDLPLEAQGPLAPPSSERPAYLLYTSGSTGRPKGVVITQGNLAASNGARFLAYDTPPRRFLLLSSIAFDSSVAGLFWTLASGGALVLPAEEEATDPRRLARQIADLEVTALLCVPSLYGHLLAAGAQARQLDSLRTAIVAGESCPRQLVAEHFRRLPRARIYNEYGPTEATVWATKHEMTPADAEHGVSIGRPIPGVSLEVLDPLGRRTPAGIPGQGWISGPTLARGYWRRPDLDREHFPRLAIVEPAAVESTAVEPEERRYRTGDRLAWTPDGRLRFLGRVDEQLKVRGFRIEPGEVEAALMEAPEVEAAGVVARGEQLVAFVAPGCPGENGEPEAETMVRELSAGPFRERLSDHLPEFMIPGRFFSVPELPLLPNGKIDRRQLRSLPLPSRAPTHESTETLDPRQQILVSLWEGLLGRDGIGIDDNFFQLGGHSLLAVELAAAIEADFGVVLAPADVFQNPTVRGLAERIEQQGGAEAPSFSHLFPLQPGGRGAPFLFAIPHFFSALIAERFRGERPVYGLRGVGLRPEGNRGRWPTMADLGREMVDEIRSRFPDEGVFMAGYSFGATMAFEAVRCMEELRIPVHGLFLIAPMPLDFYPFGPFRLQIDGLRQPLDELEPTQALWRLASNNHPFSKRLYQRLRWQFLTQPWRRLLCQAGALGQRAGRPLTPGIQHADVRLERFRLHSRYQPRPIRTPTTIFNAREPETDGAATWRPYCRGPFTVHPIPDPHIDEASIAAAKEEILRHLQTLETHGSP